MKLDQSFEVTAPLQRVWAALIDVERVTPCLPGASIIGPGDDGTYPGEFRVRIGPTSAAYSGRLQMEEVDSQRHVLRIQATGTDKRGQGGAKASIVSTLTSLDEDRTQVAVETDYHITGRLARFGRGGMIEEISARLVGEFARNLEAMLAGSDPVSVAPPTIALAAIESEPTPPTITLGSIGPEATTEPAPEPEPEVVEPEPEVAQPDAAQSEPEAEPAQSEPEAEPAQSEPEPAHPEPAQSEPEATQPDVAEPEPTGPDGPEPWAPFEPGPEPEPESALALSTIAPLVLKRVNENRVPLAALLVGFLLALRVLRHRGGSADS